MARQAVVQVEGTRELRKELKAAGDDLSDLKDANAEAAGIVTPVARVGAPVVSGALAGSLRSSGTASAAVIRAGYASVPYAGPVHWGWPSRGIKPNPFIVEAAKQTQPRWVAAYERAVDRILSKIRGATHA